MRERENEYILYLSKLIKKFPDSNFNLFGQKRGNNSIQFLKKEAFDDYNKNKDKYSEVYVHRKKKLFKLFYTIPMKNAWKKKYNGI